MEARADDVEGPGRVRAPVRAPVRPRLRARVRRWGARLSVLGIPLLIAAVDALSRHDRLARWDRRELSFYAFTIFLSVVLWVSLLVVASRRGGLSRFGARGILVVGAILAVGLQFYTHIQFHTYLDHRAVLVGTSILPSIGHQIWFDRYNVLRAVLPPLAIALAAPLVLRRLAPAKRIVSYHAMDCGMLALLLALFVSPERGAEQGAVPDVMYVSSMGQLARALWDHNETVERLHPGERTPLPVPPLVARPAARRNVIFVITESVRASSVCLEHKDDCKWTPFSNAAVPGRIPFMQMRALDSTTAISLAVMWSGIVPTESRAEIHSAPLLWEYAHAAGIHNAYWTSQNLLFGNQNKFLAGVPLGRTVSATQLEDNPTHETGADDGKAADWVVADIGKLEEPFYGVVQLANTHFPYRIDERYSPFQPQEEATGPGYENEILNRYQDSIYLQDVAIGRMLRGLKARPEAARTIIVFVSDHGEQMREKGAVGHTGTLFEPEIHVPFWIDAPPGTLTADEEAHLRALKDAPLTMLDVFPTMMDLLGLWDAPEIAHLRKKVPGQSLLRGGSPPDHTLYMSNCTELWACAFKNWGVMRGWTKVIAHQADRQWNCYDVHADPGELVPLTNENEPACAELTAAAMRKFGKTPF